MDDFIIEEELERDIDLGCYLIKDAGQYNRHNVLSILEWASSDLKDKLNIQLGPVTKSNREGFDNTYLKTLKRTKILVTCNPDRWEGDSRTWEAFANGPLVFVDKLYSLHQHPLIDGEHCIFYNPSNPKELLDKLNYYLSNESEAKEIAENGHNYTMKYHRSSNRIDDILAILEEKNK